MSIRSRLSSLALAVVLGLWSPAAAQTPTDPTPGPTADDLFNTNVVQRVQLFMHSKDWQALRETYRENTYYPADMHWNGLVVRNIGIRSRGLGSRNPVKPGLRLDFDRYATTQKFLGLKSLVLDNLVQDHTMMKERLVMAFLAKMGRPAPRVVHTGLWVNSEFVGLYTVVESIDKAFLERTLGDDSGYLYEYNNVAGWWFNDAGGSLDNLARIFEPKTRESEPLGESMGPVQSMLAAANSASDFTGALGQYLDLDDFVRYYATEAFLAERDGMCGYDGANNFYYYRSVKTGTARFLSWDKDNSFASADYSVWTNVDKNPLVDRALRDERLRGIFRETLARASAVVNELPEGTPPGQPAEGWLEREIRRIYDQIKDGAHADGNKGFSNGSFDEQLAHMVEFARGRAAFVAADAR
jgi:spore coat protein CotH